MFELYQQGLSLAQVAERFGVTRQTVYQAFQRRGWQMRSRTPKPQVVFRGDTYAPDPDGYYRKTYGDREWLHHAVWRHYNGPIPRGHHIHHIDRDKANNTSENLSCLLPSDHMRIHHYPREIPVQLCVWCGKTLTRKRSPGGQLETPAAVKRRLYCGQPCADAHKRGKPKGWSPRREQAPPP